jgi:hypothetical protein
MDKIIHTAFTSLDDKYHSSFTSPVRLWNALKTDYPNLKLSKVEKVLSRIEAYTLFRKPGEKRNNIKIIPSGVYSFFQMDLMDLKSLQKENDGTIYILVGICIMSRYVFVAPLKDKKQDTVFQQIKKILEVIKGQSYHVRTISFDLGHEFRSSLLIDYMGKDHTYIHYGATKNKAFFVERVQKTIKSLIFKYLHFNDTKRYIDVLNQIIYNYNNTIHSSINMSPQEALKTDPVKLWYKLYLKKEIKLVLKSEKKSESNDGEISEIKPKYSYAESYKFNRGDYVRLSIHDYSFKRSFDANFTQEIYVIHDLYRIRGKPYYILKDLNNETLTGMAAPNELTKVIYDATQMFKIESIIKKRIINNEIYFLCKFFGYGNKFNKLIKKADIENLDDIYDVKKPLSRTILK